MPCVLVVDRDYEALDLSFDVLSSRGYTVDRATSLVEGLALIRRNHPDVIVAGEIEEISGTDFFLLTRRLSFEGEFLLALEANALRAAVEAAKLGVFDCVRRPFDGSELVDAIEKAVRGRNACKTALDFPTLQKWVDVIAAVMRSEFDTRTVADWCRAAGLSRPTLEKLCRAVGVSAKNSLDLARVLRAAMHARQHKCRLEVLLNCDLRTFQRLCRTAGLSPDVGLLQDVGTLSTVLEQQQFITDKRALGALKQNLVRQGTLELSEYSPTSLAALEPITISSHDRPS